MIQKTTYDKIIHIMVFILINFIAIRFCSSIQLTDNQQIVIVGITTLCYMFISTYYPQFTINNS